MLELSMTTELLILGLVILLVVMETIAMQGIITNINNLDARQSDSETGIVCLTNQGSVWSDSIYNPEDKLGLVKTIVDIGLLFNGFVLLYVLMFVDFEKDILSSTDNIGLRLILIGSVVSLVSLTFTSSWFDRIQSINGELTRCIDTNSVDPEFSSIYWYNVMWMFGTFFTLIGFLMYSFTPNVSYIQRQNLRIGEAAITTR